MKQKEKQYLDNNQASIVYDSDSLDIVITQTKDAFKYFLNHHEMNWSFIHHTDNKNFKTLLKEGPVYIVRFKTGKFANKTSIIYFPKLVFIDHEADEVNFWHLAEEYDDLIEFGWWNHELNPIWAALVFDIDAENFEEEHYSYLIDQLPKSIRYISGQPKHYQVQAVKKDLHAIFYIDDPIEYVQMLSVIDVGFHIRLISNPAKSVLYYVKSWIGTEFISNDMSDHIKQILKSAVSRSTKISNEEKLELTMDLS